MSRVFEDFTDFGIGNRLTSNSPVLGDHTYTPSMTQHFWYAPQSFTPVHDADGNLTGDGRWTYLWDAENRLIQMESSTQATAAGHPYTKLQFVYDWQGRRIARHVWQGGTQASPSFKSSRRWLYDGWNVITEFSAPSATSTTLTRLNTFTWGLDLGDHDGIPRQRAGGIGGLLAQTAVSGGVIERASYDGNGNIVAWTKSNSSAPTTRREYDAFGNTLVSEGTSPSTFGFSTKMQDVETGLYYYGYRFYEPVTGRWPSRDPIEECGGENLHSFVANSPVNFLDYMGLKDFLIGFYGAGSHKGYGNVWFKKIYDAAGGADYLFSDGQDGKAIKKLFGEIDTNKDKRIISSEISEHTYRATGYSWGGPTTTHLTRQLFLKEGQKKKRIAGYELCATVPFKVIVTVDPVTLLKGMKATEDNVERWVNYYQKRDVSLMDLFQDGKPLGQQKFGNFASKNFHGKSWSEADKNINVPVDWAGKSRRQEFIPGSPIIGVMSGSQVNHDTITWFVYGDAVSELK